MVDSFYLADPQIGGEDVEDEDVEDIVHRKLAESGYFSCPSRQIECEYHHGVLTLRGRVPSFYLKQVAQTVLKNTVGIERIDNQVDVVSSTGLSSVPTW